MDAAWIAGIFGLVGVGVGTAATLVGPWLIEERKEKVEAKKRREAKLEEFVSTLYEHKHWLDTMRNVRMFGTLDPGTMSPFAKLEALATVHFPKLLPKLSDLERTTDAYELWMMEKGAERRRSGQANNEGLVDAFKPYLAAHRAMLAEARDYAKVEFQ